ncbi:MAG: hypothetical protein IPI02_21035 [Sterolibacteriaceae bacterium]|nr:hypothetical protein [Sterolibacteriaceae bacterium]
MFPTDSVFAAAKNEPFRLSSALPFDVNVNEVQALVSQGKVLDAQRAFDLLSWQAFIALNWPANVKGEPDKSKTIADTLAPRVWSFWRPAETVFLPDGRKPAAWSLANNRALNTPVFRAKAAWRQHSSGADENFQAFSGPLVDQNGKWVRYEVYINKSEFDYIFANELYSQDGQVAFSKRPKNNQVDFPANLGRTKHGAIEIKLAWKELKEGVDDFNRFYHTKVKVTLSEPWKPGQTEPETKVIDAGLVGMHIAMRTESSPEWIWSTFEQVDNVRVNLNSHGKSVRPNFFNPDLSEPVNVLPAKNATIDPKTGHPVIVSGPTATTWVESLTTKPVQTTRVEVPTQGQLNPLDAKLREVAQALNKEVQDQLRRQNSVFQYYELIDTQWPVHPNAPAFAGGADSAPESISNKTPGDVIPVFLVNTTMETYFQKGRQEAGALEQDDRLAPGAPSIDSTIVIGTESCVGCHYSAGIAIGFKRNAAGEEILQNGYPIAIYGENGHFGKTGNAHFSWLLQLEAKAKPRNGAMPHAPAPYNRPASLLDIKKHVEGYLTPASPK